MKFCLSDDTLYAHFDGELAPDASMDVSRHLAGCAMCSVKARELEQALKLIGRALDVELPGNIPTKRLYAKLNASLNEAPAPALRVAPVSSSRHLIPGSVAKIFEGLSNPSSRFAYASIIAFFIAVTLALAMGAWRLRPLKANGNERAAQQAANPTDSASVSKAQAPDQQADGITGGGETNAKNEREQTNTVARRAGTAKPAGENQGNRSNSTPRRVFALEARLKESGLSPGEPGAKRYAALTEAVSGKRGTEFLDAETAKHIEKAQSLFHSIMKLRSSRGKIALDVTYEKQLSRRLLNNNNLLSRRAETQGNWLAEELLGRLEPFLLDIANLPDRPSLNEVRLIKELVRDKEIISSL